MDTVTPPAGLEEALERPRRSPDRELRYGSVVEAIAVAPTKSAAHGRFQLTLFRSDHRRTERLDVDFKVAQLFDADDREAVRAAMHERLDVLLDRMGMPE